MRAWQENALTEFQGMNTESQILDGMSQVARDLGFDHVAYGIRYSYPISNPKTTILSTYPNEWKLKYALGGYLHIDPTIKRGLRSLLPVYWENSAERSSLPEFWEEASGYGLDCGCAQTVRDFHGAVGMLTVVRSGTNVSALELSEIELRLLWFAQILHQALTRIKGADPKHEVTLTSQEVLVLKWCSEGKTSSEVGQLMNVSERTINFHMNNAMCKLGAANRVSAVVQAAVLGLLS